MDVFDKMNWLIDKRHGLGIPMNVMGRYCGCHPSTVKYYLEDTNRPVKQETIQKYEAALNELITDFKKHMIEEE